MKRKLILCLALLCGLSAAFGQAASSCGSARDTDLDGTFASSTSTDPCSGGHTILQDKLSPHELKPAANHDAYLALNVPVAKPFRFSSWESSDTLLGATAQLDSFMSDKVSAPIAKRKLLVLLPARVFIISPDMSLAVPPQPFGTRLNHNRNS